MPRYRSPLLALSLLFAVLAVVMVGYTLYMLVGQTPRLIPIDQQLADAASATTATAPADAEQDDSRPVPTELAARAWVSTPILQATAPAGGWCDGAQLRPLTAPLIPIAAGGWRARGMYTLLGCPSATRMLRWAGSSVAQWRVDFWNATDGVRLERTAQGTWQGSLLFSRGTAPIPPAGQLPSDPCFLREHQWQRIDKMIRFYWGQGAPEPGIWPNGFAARWTGFIYAAGTGGYTFHLISSGSARLGIDGHKVIDEWTPHRRRQTDGACTLTQGWHDLVLEYHDSLEEEATVHLRWQGAGQGYDDIQPDKLCPAPLPEQDDPQWRTAEKPTAFGRLGDSLPYGLTGTYYWGQTYQPRFAEPARVQVDAQEDPATVGPDTSPVDVRYQEGHMVVARADRVVLSLPLAQPPIAGLATLEAEVTQWQRLPARPLALEKREPWPAPWTLRDALWEEFLQKQGGAAAATAQLTVAQRWALLGGAALSGQPPSAPTLETNNALLATWLARREMENQSNQAKQSTPPLLPAAWLEPWLDAPEAVAIPKGAAPPPAAVDSQGKDGLTPHDLAPGPVLDPSQAWPGRAVTLPAGTPAENQINATVAVAAAKEWLFVQDALHLTALRLDTGRIAWQNDTKSQGAKLAPVLRPLVGNGYVITAATNVDKNEGVIMCLPWAGGTPRWRRALGSAVISDPVLVRGRLVVAALHPGEGEQHTAQAVLHWLAPDTGVDEVLTPLGRVRDEPYWLRMGRPMVTADGLVMRGGGRVLYLNTNGTVRWARDLPWWVLDARDDHPLAQELDDMGVDHDRIIVTAPGCPLVMSLRTTDGAIMWQAAPPGLRRLVGVTPGRVIVATGTDIQALDADTGQGRWTAPLPTTTDDAGATVLPGAGDTIVNITGAEAGGAPLAHWRSALDGLELQTSPLAASITGVPVGLHVSDGVVWWVTASDQGRRLYVLDPLPGR